MKLIIFIFIILMAICPNATAYFEDLPQRSWDIPPVIKSVRKMPREAVTPELRQITELVDRAAMLAGQEEDDWGAAPNYEKWEKASALFANAIELYRQSRNSRIEMKRLAAYAMNKRSLLIWAVGKNVSDPALVKQQMEAVNELLTELGNCNDPEVEINIFEAKVDLGINKIMAGNLKGKEARDFLNDLEGLCSRLNNDESQYHLGRYLLPYAMATLGGNDDEPDKWKHYIEKNWKSDHPGVGSCIIEMQKSPVYRPETGYTLEDILWRYGASKDRRIQRLLALHMPSLHVVNEGIKLEEVTNELEDRYGSSPYPEVEQWVVAALSQTVLELLSQDRVREGNELYERILKKYQDKPNLGTHMQIMELLSSMILSYEERKDEDGVLHTAQRLERHMKKLPRELQRGILLITPIKYQGDIYEKRGDIQKSLKLYQELAKEYEHELREAQFLEDIENKINKLRNTNIN